MARPLSAPMKELPSYVLSIFDKQFGCINVQDLENYVQCKWHHTELPSADEYNDAWWGWPNWVFRNNDTLRDILYFLLDWKYLIAALLWILIFSLFARIIYRFTLSLFPKAVAFQPHHRPRPPPARRSISADDIFLSKED